MSHPNTESLVVPPGAGDAYWSVGDLLTFKIGAEHTNGAWSMAETTVVPGGGPPPHIHRREDETFYLLDGQMTFMRGDDVFLAGPGDAFFLKRDEVHTFHNPGKTPARMLVLAAPCGFEKFMLEFARPKSESNDPPPVRKEDIDRLIATAPKYGIEMKFDHKPCNAPKAANCIKKSLWVSGNRIDLKLTANDTGGASTVCTVTSRPGFGPPPHKHVATDEVFFVEAGRFEFLLGDRTGIVEPGTTVFIPRGMMHDYHNVGDSVGRLASFHFPSGIENFFLDAGVECTDPNRPPPETLNMARMMQLIRKHGMEL
jgi:mannose-6-phosphate isomerase-like protein (cupin superfamily)